MSQDKNGAHAQKSNRARPSWGVLRRASTDGSVCSVWWRGVRLMREWWSIVFWEAISNTCHCLVLMNIDGHNKHNRLTYIFLATEQSYFIFELTFLLHISVQSRSDWYLWFCGECVKVWAAELGRQTPPGLSLSTLPSAVNVAIFLR